MIDLICGVIISFTTFRGFKRGLILSLLSLLELVAGYLVAYFFHHIVGQLLIKLFSLQPIVAYPVAGLVCFVSGALMVGLVTRAARRHRRYQQRLGRSPMLLGRLAGAVLGAAYGAALAMVLVWILLLAYAAYPDKVPNPRNTVAGRLSAPLWARTVGRVARRVSGSGALSVAAEQLAKDPARATRDMQTVLAHRRVQALVRNPRQLKGLASSDPQQLARHPLVRSLSRDRKFVEAAQRLGLLDATAERPSPQQVRQQLAARLAPLSRSEMAISNDPEVRQLLNDPQLKGRLQRRELGALANDPQFNKLVEKVLAHMRRAGAGSTPAGE